MKLQSKPLSDGKWHHLEVTWIGTEIKLAIDYGEKFFLSPFVHKIQGLFIGKILIGGPDNSYSSLNAGYNYFEGCIQDVRIGSQQTILSRPTVKENVLDGCESNGECQSECPLNSECIPEWGDSHCQCKDGFVGSLCVPVCSLNPCKNNASCIEDFGDYRKYSCECGSSELSGMCE